MGQVNLAQTQVVGTDQQAQRQRAPARCAQHKGPAQRGLHGLLCTQFKVLHINGPYYAHLFGFFEAEIAKFRSVDRPDMVEFYEGLRGQLPSLADLQQGLATAMTHIDSFDPPLPAQ